MTTYSTVLFIHLLSLAIGFGAGGTLVACLFQLRAARTVEDAAPWAMVASRTERAFPVAILGLFFTGAYMTSDVWTWGTGWIDVSIVGLVLLSLQGPLVGGRAVKQLERTLHANGPGALGEEARRMTVQPALWLTEFTNLGLVFGIMWNMTQKPGTAGAILALVVAYVVGAALALGLGRRAGAAPEAVRSTV